MSILRSSFDSFPSRAASFERVVASAESGHDEREEWSQITRRKQLVSVARSMQRRRKPYLRAQHWTENFFLHVCARTEVVEERRELRHSDLDALDKVSLRPIPLHCHRVRQRARRSASLLRVPPAAEHVFLLRTATVVHTLSAMVGVTAALLRLFRGTSVWSACIPCRTH